MSVWVYGAYMFVCLEHMTADSGREHVIGYEIGQPWLQSAILGMLFHRNVQTVHEQPLTFICAVISRMNVFAHVVHRMTIAVGGCAESLL